MDGERKRECRERQTEGERLHGIGRKIRKVGK